MKRLMILICVFLMAGAGFSEELDRIAIVVNNRSVTLHELQKMATVMSMGLQQQFTGDDLESKLKEMKERLIDDKFNQMLLLEKADEEGIAFTDSMMDQMIDTFMEQNNFKSREELEDALKAQMGMTLDEYMQIRKVEQVADSVVYRLVIAKIRIDEAESRAYYENNKQDFMTDYNYSIQEIVFFNNGSSSVFSKSKAQKCLDEIKSGALDFNAAVSQYSESGSKEYNGELQNIKKGELHFKLEQAALSMSVGDVSDIIELDESVHIIKLTSINQPEPVPFKEVRAEIENKLRQPQIEEKLKAFKEKLKNSYYVQVNVKPEDL